MHADASITDVQAKLVIIHQFISRYMQWPDRYSLEEGGDVRICYIGRDEVTRELPMLEKASTDFLRVSIVANPNRSAMRSCHAVYLPSSQRWQLRNVLDNLARYPVLTISDIKHFARDGGMVELTGESQRQGNFEREFVRYNLNIKVMSEVGLVMDPGAIELARDVIE